MILTDMHTHSAYSADGRSPLCDMVTAAQKRGVRYYGINEHFDYDYRAQSITYCGRTIPMTDAEKYFDEIRRLQQTAQTADFRLLAGGEFGFAPLARCFEEYGELVERFRPDYVINSVHTCDGEECMSPEYFTGKSKDYAYRAYLNRVRESLEVPYPYDIVAHIGYVSRKAPYADPKIRYEDYANEYDDILKTLIAKGKILEINTSPRGAQSVFLPDCDILRRYRSLGGTLVSYGSDAHETTRICDKREEVITALKQIGYTHLTVPVCGDYKQIPL